MSRLCVDRFTVTSRIITVLVSYTLLITPVWAAPSSSLGTVVYADRAHVGAARTGVIKRDRKSTRLNSSHGYISYAVFCLKNNNTQTTWMTLPEITDHKILRYDLLLAKMISTNPI